MYHPKTIRKIILLIQNSLSPDLLVGRWKKQVKKLDGHCYIAAEALWHLLGRVDYFPYFAVYKDEGGRATHWWLVNKHTKKIVDPTKEQYLPDDPPYHLGKRGGFLTKLPSKRAKLVISRVRSHKKFNEIMGG